MAVSRALRQIRTMLIAGVLTPVSPPAVFVKCMIANGTGADVTLSSTDNLEDNEYRIISSQFEREVRAESLHGFRHNEIAFWLYSARGGLVILEWC